MLLVLWKELTTVKARLLASLAFVVAALTLLTTAWLLEGAPVPAPTGTHHVGVLDTSPNKNTETVREVSLQGLDGNACVYMTAHLGTWLGALRWIEAGVALCQGGQPVIYAYVGPEDIGQPGWAWGPVIAEGQYVKLWVRWECAANGRVWGSAGYFNEQGWRIWLVIHHEFDTTCRKPDIMTNVLEWNHAGAEPVLEAGRVRNAQICTSQGVGYGWNCNLWVGGTVVSALENFRAYIIKPNYEWWGQGLSPTPTPTPIPTATPTSTVTPTATPTTIPSPTSTPSPTTTPTANPSPTSTATPTPTPCPRGYCWELVTPTPTAAKER